MARHYQQGRYIPKYPEKYRGDVTQIFMRSSYERRFAIWADNNPAVVEWGNEINIVPYISPVDNQVHRYFVDFFIKVKTRDKDIVTYLVEIKPQVQCYPPKATTKSGRRVRAEVLLEQEQTYAVNQAKWKYATKYAKQRGWKFIVLTEVELGIKK